MNALEPYASRYRIDHLSSMQWGHYSPLGNAIIAKYILGQLNEWDLVDAPKLSLAAQEERHRLGVEVQ